jgi:peptide/nickel transport system substrate-binding protein
MKKKLLVFLMLTLLASLLLNACAPAATQVAAEGTAAPANTTAPQNTAVENTPTTAPTEVPSLVGGTLTIAVSNEADTLDPQKTVSGVGSFIMSNIYSSLIAFGPGGNYVPYLASSWEVSADGLTYTFHLRNDVFFHNGDPLTAQDVAWTYQRALDPETASPATAAYLANVETITAVDDYTVEIKLAIPYYYLLDSLAIDSFEGILSQKAVEAAGDDYGRNPVGTGPFIFKEWVTGDHITLERNPDFTWGPAGITPPNIQTVIFRLIPEGATIVAGLEAGELDYVGNGIIQGLDVKNLEATGNFDIVRNPVQALLPYITLNVSKPPFDDIRIRQALNYAVDEQAIIDLVIPDSGAVIENGPLTPSIEGYWPGIEEMGYNYDLEKAKQLMLDAGYTYNADGMLEKDGVPFSFELITVNGFDVVNKEAEVIQAQWKELGVDVQLNQLDGGVGYQKMLAGDYQSSVNGWGWPNSDLLTQLFHSKNIGGSNMSWVTDPELDTILDNMVTATNTEEHLNFAKEAQIRIVQQAYIVTLFNQVNADIINNRIKGYEDSTYNGFRIWNAYIGE